MKTSLLIAGPEAQYGYGHLTRMQALALELRKHKVTSTLVVLDENKTVEFPMPFGVALLDRRDTAFPPSVKNSGAWLVSLDNRGEGRLEADRVYDALPHYSMAEDAYKDALANLLLSPHLTNEESRSNEARVALHATKEDAQRFAEFPRETIRQSPAVFLEALKNAESVVCYFGQTFFEALYLGKEIHLYSPTPYHATLTKDFLRRIEANPALVDAIDGKGLLRLTRCVLNLLKQERGLSQKENTAEDNLW